MVVKPQGFLSGLWIKHLLEGSEHLLGYGRICSLGHGLASLFLRVSRATPGFAVTATLHLEEPSFKSRCSFS